MAKQWFDKLLAERCFSLQRISPLTYPQDITIRHTRGGERVSAKELESLADLIRGGDCFRCKIGRGRYHYRKTADAAIEAALAGKKKRKR